jgi:hypothetical protein
MPEPTEREWLEGIARWACGHPETTDEDGTGAAICVRCAATVVVRCTSERLESSIDLLRRYGA